MAVRLVFIHGRGQGGLDPKVLQSEWEDTLEKGFANAGLSRPAGLEVAFPFYGDRLDHLIQLIEAPIIHDVLTRGGKIESETTRLQGRILQEIAESPDSPISSADIEAQFAGAEHERDAQNWPFVIAIAKALDHTPLGGSTIDLVTHDVAVYLANDGVRLQIDKIVAAAFCAGPCVVAAHSLGTVVGYNVLRTAAAGSDVRLFATVGSPLGIRAVKAKLGSPACVMPECARAWFNARDRQDIVAAYPLDEKTFNIDPAITNKSDVYNHTSNHHGIEGYLADPVVASQIHAALVN